MLKTSRSNLAFSTKIFVLLNVVFTFILGQVRQISLFSGQFNYASVQSLENNPLKVS